MKTIFSMYEDCFGQIINFDKFSVFFSKDFPVTLQQDICSLFQIPEGSRSNKYLGLPFMIGR